MGQLLIDKDGDEGQLVLNNLTRLCNPVTMAQVIFLKDELLTKVIRRNEIHHNYYRSTLEFLKTNGTIVPVCRITLSELFIKLFDVNNKILDIEIRKDQHYIGALALIEKKLLEQDNKETVLKDLIKEIHTGMSTQNINKNEIQDNKLEYYRQINLY